MVLVAGAPRLGRAVSFIPWPVIEGFTLGIAVIIFLQQVPAAHRAPMPAASCTRTSSSTAVSSLRRADPIYLAWSLCAVADRRGVHVPAAASAPGDPRLARRHRRSSRLLALVLPSPLAVIGALPTRLPAPGLPSFSLDTLSQLLPARRRRRGARRDRVAAVRTRRRLPRRHRPVRPRPRTRRAGARLDRRGPVRRDAGDRCDRPHGGERPRRRPRPGSPRSSTRSCCSLVVLVAAGPVGAIPLAALSGVLMVTAVRMVHLATARSILRSTRADAIAYVVTAVVTVSVDLIVAVGHRHGRRRRVRDPRPLAGDGRAPRADRRACRSPATTASPSIRLDGPLFFAAADRVLETVTSLRRRDRGDPADVAARARRRDRGARAVARSSSSSSAAA